MTHVGIKAAPWSTFYKSVNDFAPCLEEFFDHLSPCRGRTVLDLGCGNGRNIPRLVEAGMVVHAIDNNSVALHTARMRVAPYRDALPPKRMDMCHLDYPDAFFDAVVAISVLNHGTRAEVDRAFTEVQRVLKPRGLFLVTMISTTHRTYGKGEEIDADTFILDEGVDAGVPHRFFDLDAFAVFLVAHQFVIRTVRPAGIREIGGVNDGHILAIAERADST